MELQPDLTTQVTSLGYYDFQANGLAEAHPVGIFSSTGTLLASATVPAGTAGTLLESFRYVPISALTLPAGTYTIGGFTSSTLDVIAIAATTINTIPGVTYLGSRAAISSGLTFAPTDEGFLQVPISDPIFRSLPPAAYRTPERVFCCSAWV